MLHCLLRKLVPAQMVFFPVVLRGNLVGMRSKTVQFRSPLMCIFHDAPY